MSSINRKAVHVEDDVHLWWTIMKQLRKDKNISQTMRAVFEKAYPNIGNIANEFKRHEVERQQAIDAFSESIVDE